MPASRHLQQLVEDTARVIDRSFDDVRPFLKKLEENWFDTVESVRTITAKDLQDLGIPLRFARELVALAQGGGGGAGGESGSAPPPPPAPPVSAPPVPAPASSPHSVPPRVPPKRAAGGSVPHPPQRPVPLPKQRPTKGKGESYGEQMADWNDWRNDRNERSDWERPEKGKSSGKGKTIGTKGDRKGGKGKASSWNWDAWQPQHSHSKGSGHEEDWGKGTREGSGYKWDYQRDPNAKGHSKTAASAAAPTVHTHKIFLDIDPQPGFGLNGRLIGTNGQNMKHIQSITGAEVKLQGHGSGEHAPTEGLHVLLQSFDAHSLEEAIRVTNDLIDTVLEQYAAYQQQGPSSKGSGKSGGKKTSKTWQSHFEEPHAKRNKMH